ncbi:hypothetical protein RJ55_02098 [Drechmeria coniospora]|nr:hypothetical protein RJ55_02098 [Drechmeria coniospora]
MGSENLSQSTPTVTLSGSPAIADVRPNLGNKHHRRIEITPSSVHFHDTIPLAQSTQHAASETRRIQL